MSWQGHSSCREYKSFAALVNMQGATGLGGVRQAAAGRPRADRSRLRRRAHRWAPRRTCSARAPSTRCSTRARRWHTSRWTRRRSSRRAAGSHPFYKLDAVAAVPVCGLDAAYQDRDAPLAGKVGACALYIRCSQAGLSWQWPDEQGRHARSEMMYVGYTYMSYI